MESESPGHLSTQAGGGQAPWPGVPAGVRVWGMPRLPLLTAALCLVAAAPAGAVVDGEPLDEAQVPWFANLGCGGSLVAPDRVLTAAHCVGGERARRPHRRGPGAHGQGRLPGAGLAARQRSATTTSTTSRS